MKRLLFLMLLATPAFAQGVPYENFLMTAGGPGGSLIPVSFATITVCAGIHVEVPCTPSVTLYSDVPLTQVITPPLTSGPLGNYRFVLAPGTWSVSFTGPGISAANDVIVLGANVAGSSFTGTNTITKLNNIIAVDGVTYPCTSVGVNAAITAQITAGGGTVDARNCPSLSSYTSEIDVGNASSVAIDLLVPHTGTWLCNITDGVSYCLKVFNLSSVIGSDSYGNAAFQIRPATSSVNVGALCGNDTSAGANSRVRMEGFGCVWFSGTGTAAKAVGYFSGLADDSFVSLELVNLSSTNVPKVLWVDNSCCGASFTNYADAFGLAGVTPCTFGNGTAKPNLNINAYGSCVHAGSGASNLVDQEWNQFGHNTFRIYEEYLAGADTTTAATAVQAFGTPTSADIFNIKLGGDVASSTRSALDIASGAHAIATLTQGTVSTNAINDHNGNGTITAPVNTTIGYSTERQFLSNTIQLGISTVAALPSAASNPGAMIRVSDSTTVAAEGQTCVGSSSNNALAFSNGSVWKCF